MQSRTALMMLTAICILSCMIANAQPTNQNLKAGISKVNSIGQQATGQQYPDLTGVWGCNDGAHYYIRQIGNVVWWYGENDPSSPSFSNVFYGTISEYSPTYIITGNWADVPKGKYASQSGTLTLAIETNNKLATMKQTGNFGGTSWVRPV
jgi:hypothetical protein